MLSQEFAKRDNELAQGGDRVLELHGLFSELPDPGDLRFCYSALAHIDQVEAGETRPLVQPGMRVSVRLRVDRDVRFRIGPA